MLAAEGRFEEGYILARDPNPVAAICGYVCSAPCEKACRRADIDKPLAIRAMKRFLVDWHYGNNMPDNVVVAAAHRAERRRHRRRAGRPRRRQGARQLGPRGPRLRGAAVRRRHHPHRRARPSACRATSSSST